MGTPRKFSKEQVDQARSLYLRYVPWQEIAKATGLGETNIKKYANTGWRKQRDALKSELMESALESKRGLLLSIAKHGLEIVEKGLKDLLSSDKQLTTKELQNIAGIVENFDKIVKLDDGHATERTEVIQPATVIELKRMLNDPFTSEIEDAQIVAPIKKIEN